MSQLFLDMDGVLADFDEHHERVCGFRSSRQLDNTDWDTVAKTPYFYRDIPPMPDLNTLWLFCAPLKPIVLTGIPAPSRKMIEAEDNKREWVDRYLGRHVRMIACQARHKSKVCRPGDILIDDWEKYRSLWEEKGGIWITHTTAATSVEKLLEVLGA